jgi:hypothetical protein
MDFWSQNQVFGYTLTFTYLLLNYCKMFVNILYLQLMTKYHGHYPLGRTPDAGIRNPPYWASRAACALPLPQGRIA